MFRRTGTAQTVWRSRGRPIRVWLRSLRARAIRMGRGTGRRRSTSRICAVVTFSGWTTWARALRRVSPRRLSAAGTRSRLAGRAASRRIRTRRRRSRRTIMGSQALLPCQAVSRTAHLPLASAAWHFRTTFIALLTQHMLIRLPCSRDLSMTLHLLALIVVNLSHRPAMPLQQTALQLESQLAIPHHFRQSAAHPRCRVLWATERSRPASARSVRRTRAPAARTTTWLRGWPATFS